MALKTRKPTGVVPWPLILVEGAEKAGKSWMCAELSASEKVGRTFWIDIGEGSGDEYGAIPGARYEIVEHNGTFGELLSAVAEIKTLAQAAADAGEPPVVLVLDTATAEWEILKGIADAKARERLARKGRNLPPDAEPTISMDLWNDVNSLHRKLMTHLMTFPGIAVVTARGKWVAAIDDNGKPLEGKKEYRVEAQKNLAYDASVWVRVSREHPPMVIGCRSVHAGIRPGVDDPRAVPGLTLEQVVFDVLKCDPRTARPRDLVEPAPTLDDPTATPEQQAATGPSGEALVARGHKAIAGATTRDQLAAIDARTSELLQAGSISEESAAELRASIRARTTEVEGNTNKAESDGASQQLHNRMHALWAQLPAYADRESRLTVTSMVIGRDVASSSELRPAEGKQLMDWLERRVAEEQDKKVGAAA